MLGEYDQRLEIVATRLALPEVQHVMLVQIFGPFREEDRLPALGAMVSRLAVVLGILGLEFHDATSVMFPRHEAHGSAVA